MFQIRPSSGRQSDLLTRPLRHPRHDRGSTSRKVIYSSLPGHGPRWWRSSRQAGRSRRSWRRSGATLWHNTGGGISAAWTQLRIWGCRILMPTHRYAPGGPGTSQRRPAGIRGRLGRAAVPWRGCLFRSPAPIPTGPQRWSQLVPRTPRNPAEHAAGDPARRSTGAAGPSTTLEQSAGFPLAAIFAFCAGPSFPLRAAPLPPPP